MSSLDQAQDVYSSTVHKAIIAINGGAYALLQVVTNQSWAPTKAAAHRSITIYPGFLGAKSDLRHPSSLRSQAPKQTSYPQFRGTHQSSLWGSRSYHAHLPYFDHFQSHRCCPLSSNPHEANLTEASSQLPI
ncbi:predicted protein [Arabidopsis lyrata subsp. lyrata]|uniref:Predicted protein n=1 Tax=Arabidopsis lyrata subsp. lyrata TaxID=81972 RepID=D7KHJ2_ARALL|nr:predicted protein [Arabidopsis lyrata subsp. lyrata]